MNLAFYILISLAIFSMVGLYVIKLISDRD